MFKNVYDEKDPSGRGRNEVCERNVWAAGWSRQDHAIQERHSVLTNQCLGKETNAEPLAEELKNPF